MKKKNDESLETGLARTTDRDRRASEAMFMLRVLMGFFLGLVPLHWTQRAAKNDAQYTRGSNWNIYFWDTLFAMTRHVGFNNVGSFPGILTTSSSWESPRSVSRLLFLNARFIFYSGFLNIAPGSTFIHFWSPHKRHFLLGFLASYGEKKRFMLNFDNFEGGWGVGHSGKTLRW